MSRHKRLSVKPSLFLCGCHSPEESSSHWLKSSDSMLLAKCFSVLLSTKLTDRLRERWKEGWKKVLEECLAWLKNVIKASQWVNSSGFRMDHYNLTLWPDHRSKEEKKSWLILFKKYLLNCSYPVLFFVFQKRIKPFWIHVWHQSLKQRTFPVSNVETKPLFWMIVKDS